MTTAVHGETARLYGNSLLILLFLFSKPPVSCTENLLWKYIDISKQQFAREGKFLFCKWLVKNDFFCKFSGDQRKFLAKNVYKMVCWDKQFDNNDERHCDKRWQIYLQFALGTVCIFVRNREVSFCLYLYAIQTNFCGKNVDKQQTIHLTRMFIVTNIDK